MTILENLYNTNQDFKLIVDKAVNEIKSIEFNEDDTWLEVKDKIIKKMENIDYEFTLTDKQDCDLLRMLLICTNREHPLELEVFNKFSNYIFLNNNLFRWKNLIGFKVLTTLSNTTFILKAYLKYNFHSYKLFQFKEIVNYLNAFVGDTKSPSSIVISDRIDDNLYKYDLHKLHLKNTKVRFLFDDIFNKLKEELLTIDLSISAMIFLNSKNPFLISSKSINHFFNMNSVEDNEICNYILDHYNNYEGIYRLNQFKDIIFKGYPIVLKFLELRVTFDENTDEPKLVFIIKPEYNKMSIDEDTTLFDMLLEKKELYNMQ